VQTVGRGELFAFVVLVRHLSFLVDIEYIRDNEPLYNTYNAGPKTLIYVNPDRVDWTARAYYGDASGGKYTSHRRLRRCGCGVVAVDSQGSLEFGMKCNLPGAVQTVGRGELFVFVLLVRHLPFLVDIEYITDN
jgi:hypothetical protein